MAEGDTAQRGYSLEVVTQPADLQSLRDDWRQLDEVTARPSVFLTWEWMEAWLHAVQWKRTLHVVVIREPDGRVAAIAPFMIGARGQLDRGARVLSFLGSDGPAGGTYLDLIARPEWEGRAHHAVLDHLAQNRRLFTYINLNRVAVDDGGFVHWTTAALEREMHATVDLRRRTVWMPLPDTYAAYIASIANPRWRQRMRNFPAALRKEFPTAEYVDRRAERPAANLLEDLRRLQSMRFGETGNYFQRPGFSEYMQRVCSNMQDQGRLRAQALRVDGATVAMRVGLAHRGTWVDFQVGADPSWMKHNVAHILLWHCVERAIDEGLGRMDSLDEYDYKRRYFSHTRWVADLRIFDERLASTSRQILKAAGRSARRTLRDLLPERVRALLRRR